MSDQGSNLGPEAETGVLAATGTVGSQLRLAREARGLTVDDMAKTLKLGFRQVEALENGDWGALPGATFIRGFVRNYARVVQIDAAPLMSQLDRVMVMPADNLATGSMPPAAMPSSGSGVSRRDRRFVVVALAMVVAAFLAYVLLPGSLSDWHGQTRDFLDSLAKPGDGVEEVVTSPVTSPAAPSSSEPVFPPGATPQQIMYPQEQALTGNQASVAPEPAAVPVDEPRAAASLAPVLPADAPQLRFLVSKESWLEVRDRNSKSLLAQSFADGAEHVLSGDGPLSVVIGNAPGVKLFWRGQAVDLVPHSKGNVARLVLE